MSGAGSQHGPEDIGKLRRYESEYELLLLRVQDPMQEDALKEKLAKIKALIAERENRFETLPVLRQATAAPGPEEVFSGEVDRTELFDNLLNFARTRDIIFAIGGVGSGLRHSRNDFTNI